MELSPEQQTAVACHTHNAIVAIPGSGKTRVLTEKCKHLIAQGEQYILALSYTRASSLELLGRIEQAVGEVPDYVIRVATFHKLLYDHLMEHGFIDRFVDASRQMSILHEILAQHNADEFKMPQIMQFIATSDADISMQEKALSGTIKFGAPSERNEAKTQLSLLNQLRNIRKAYKDYLLTHDLYSLESLIEYAMQKFTHGQLPLLGINHLLIDEFQDADPQQVAFALLHGLSGVIVTVVGDDDQSIYKFREAMGYDAFELVRQKLGAQYLTLSTNYRSHAEILSLSFDLVEQNMYRIEKQPVAFQGQGGRVYLEIFPSDIKEIEYIAEHIRAQPDVRTFIICRTNAYLNVIERMLNELSIETQRIGRPHRFDTPIIHQLVSMFSHLVKNTQHALPHDGHVLLPGVESHFFTHHSLMGQTLPSAKPKSYQSYRDTYQHCRGNRLNEAINTFFNGCGLVYAGTAQANVVALFGKRLSLIKGTLSQRLMLIMQSSTTDEQCNVQLMSMHGSKGLEAPRVFVVGVNHNAMPNAKAVEEFGQAGIEEERRLLFVAMTRAEKELHVSGLFTPNGVRPVRVPSRFLLDMMAKRGDDVSDALAAIK